MTRIRQSLITFALSSLIAGGSVWAQTETASSTDSYTPTVGQGGKDVVWVPTPQALVDRMLDLAKLTPQDKLVDLGSGDGRTVITAAKRGATARGIEFNPDMVALSRRQAQAEGVTDRASFEQADIFESDFSEATVVTLFLLPRLNLKLRPTLLDMAPGTRILANSFDMADWEPDETADAGEGCTAYCKALKWVVPAKVEGSWTLDGTPLTFTQTFQKLEGQLGAGKQAQVLSGRLLGRQIEFTIGKDRYTGEVLNGTMHGTVNGSRPWLARR